MPLQDAAPAGRPPPRARTPLGTLAADGRSAPRTRRADASRNRERILAAADALMGARPDVTMEEIAAEAGVGKGTLYRNFTGRGQLAEALLDDRSRELQARVLREAAPGAGADPAERLARYLGLLLDFTADNIDLLCVAGAGGADARTEQAYVWQRQVAAALLREGAAGRPEIDVEHLADALPSLVRPELVRHQLEVVGLDRERIRASIARLARAALA